MTRFDRLLKNDTIFYERGNPPKTACNHTVKWTGYTFVINSQLTVRKII